MSLASTSVPQPQLRIVRVVAHVADAVLQPLLSPGTGSPTRAPVLLAVLAAVQRPVAAFAGVILFAAVLVNTYIGRRAQGARK